MREPEARHRLAAILAADAAGYSRVMAEDDRVTLATRDAARAVFRRNIEHGYLDISPLSDTSYDSARGVERPAAAGGDSSVPILVSSHEDDFKQARIHPKVIDAFLEQPNYLHGVRSMEAIIQMSRWSDDEFVPASLPSEDLLKAHLAREFLPPVR